jgi:hypothetical protein
VEELLWLEGDNSPELDQYLLDKMIAKKAIGAGSSSSGSSSSDSSAKPPRGEDKQKLEKTLFAETEYPKRGTVRDRLREQLATKRKGAASSTARPTTGQEGKEEKKVEGKDQEKTLE